MCRVSARCRMLLRSSAEAESEIWYPHLLKRVSYLMVRVYS